MIGDGIPDPGGPPAAFFNALERTRPASPFDPLRYVTAEGREFWSGRDLMEFLGYSQWRDFVNAIGRARTAAHNSGHEWTQHFAPARKVAASGPAAEDYHLSRYGCYLVAMAADPKKARVAEAQTYFAVKTRQAETTPPPVLTDDELIHRALVVSDRRVEELKARVAELEQPAAAWNELADAAGDYSVADAAKVLSRDPSIKTGERRLFQTMAGLGWIYRREGRWRAYQTQVERGRLTEKVGKPYYHAGREEVVAADPVVRITPKGLEALHKRLGGSGQLELLAGVS